MTDGQMFDQMMQICAQNEAFYFADQQLGPHSYRIFLYRLASYSDWHIHPLTKEMRGIMFQNHPEFGWRLVCRPMEKFWNLNENPDVMDLPLDCCGIANDKLDGSLISTFMYQDEGYPELGLKSKGSLHSDQARAATAWINQPCNGKFLSDLAIVTSDGYTVDMEWTAPDNRIVIGYPDAKLTVLSVRRNSTGEYVNHPMLQDYWVKRIPLLDVRSFVASIPTMKGIEGFVISTDKGHKFKVKTEEYTAKHRAKDGIGSAKKVAEVILAEAIDDFKSMFAGDLVLIPLIERMEQEVKTVYNNIQNRVDFFVSKNAKLDRKSFAIKAQKEMQDVFSLCMRAYLGQEPDLKSFIMKNFDELFTVDWYKPTGVSS